MKLQWKWAESVNGRFQRKFPLSPQSLNHCPPVSFTKPLRASHANQEPVWRRDWDQLENFLNTTLPFFTSNIKQILSKLPRVELLKGVGKCGCWMPKNMYILCGARRIPWNIEVFFSEEAEVESEPGYSSDCARFSSIFVFYDIVIPLWWVSRTSLDRLRHRSS